MDRFEVAGIAAMLIAFATLFGFIGYWAHEENMACIKAGGAMVDRKCMRTTLQDGE